MVAGITMIVLIIDWLFAWFFRGIAYAFDTIPQTLLFLALPLSLPALLFSVISGLRTAIYIGLFTTGIVAFSMNDSFPALITGLFVSGVVGFAVRNTSNYKSYFIHAILACIVSTIFAGIVFMGDKVYNNIPDQVFQESEEYVQKAKNPSEGKYFGIRIFVPGKKWELDPVVKYRAKTLSLDLLAVPACSSLATVLVALIILFTLESLPADIATNMSYLTFTDRNHSL